jgi:phosphatidylinositol alpha-1,6-mannosyltransferase
MLFLFSFDYPPNDGGIARLCTAIAANLQARRVPIRVLTQEYLSEDVPDIDQLVKTTRVSAKRPMREIQAFQHLRAIRQQSLCLSGIWYPEGLITHVARISPHVILAHGTELYPPSQKWRRGIWRWMRRQVLEHADLVVANSHFTADLVEFVAPGARIIALPLAVDHRQFHPQDRNSARLKWQVAEGKHVLCSVSRIHRFKGHETVLEAIARLPSPVRETFIYLVGGKGPDMEYLRTRAEQLGVTDNVRWLGFVPDDQLPSLYSASDLFVLMTREIPEDQSVEGFGLVFLEAQACGTPVVGTRTGGIPDAVADGDGGWLIEQDDVEALNAILHDLVNNPETLEAMGQKARLRVEREFTWDHYLDRFTAALEAKGIQLG